MTTILATFLNHASPSLATQGPERDVEVPEHAAWSRQGAAGPPQAAGGTCLLVYHKIIHLHNFKYQSHVYIAFLAPCVCSRRPTTRPCLGS